MIELIKILYPHPALLLNDNNEKHIVISDLHIGFEERFTKKGISYFWCRRREFQGF